MLRSIGRLELVWAVLAVLWLLIYLGVPNFGLRGLLQLVLFVLGGVIATRWMRRLIQKAIWRLRNRLVVAYIFMAVLPTVLLVTLFVTGVWLATWQLALYLVTTEFDRRLQSVETTAASVLRAPLEGRFDVARRFGEFIRSRYPGAELAISGQRTSRFPDNATITPLPENWGNGGGVMVADGLFFLWVRAATEDEAVSIRMPLTRRYLNSMVPSLGEISLVRFPEPGAKKKSMRPIQLHSENAADDLQTANAPPQLFPMDLEVSWGTPIPVSFLEAPESSEPVLLAIRSRISAVLNVFFARKFDSEGGVIALLYGSAILFLLVETIAVTIGVSITRTVTAAVHNLYEGTQRVQEGDFSHRITVKGQDQVADLSRSFNRMTENLERLLAVAKESERIQAELEIAREVQTQLYPKQVPEMRGLRVTARWQPARMVSGDYFDYQGLDGDRLALAVGDVAGKGISAALLMATVQSCFRTQINSCVEAAAAGGNGSTRISVSPSGIVSQLNRQLFAFTTPEKYATFFFGLYEDRTGTFTYTNAGHLPPILIRGGEPQLLEVNGMVVGAFPFAAYGESSVILQPGDLLVFYTDGITEPQNEYGEMFGENRMIETIARQASLESDAIIASVLESVERWTGSPELQDDQTLIIARRQ